MVIKKCNKCGAVVKVLHDCTCEDCGIKCCGEEMKVLTPNSEDASFEKHVPTYEVDGDIMNITVNHVMDEDHYIEWISIVDGDNEVTFYTKPGDINKVRHLYIPGAKIYAYCNKHGLWVKEVE